MRVLTILTAVGALAFTPAYAAHPDDAGPPQELSNSSRSAHLVLADRYLELTQGGELMKQMRAQIEATYADIDLPADQRAWVTQQMTQILEEVINLTLAEVREDVADLFTVAELESAVAFFSSAHGRSVARKQVDLNLRFHEVMTPLILPRLTSMAEKFCQRFDCDQPAGAAAKGAR